jgi:D-sedoheptulose 7-phosphate isomerase
VRNVILNELKENVEVISALNIEEIENIAEALVTIFKNKKKAIFFGNGGSASDAQHLAAEFSGKYLLDRDPLPAISLTSNISAVTAISNDYSYDDIFQRQLKALIEKGDAAIGISTSGNSINVLNAIEMAKELGAVTIGFTGSRGKLKDIVDYHLIVPSNCTPRIQEGYMVAGHIICGIIERIIYEQKSSFYR